jgi:hypothetical protein
MPLRPRFCSDLQLPAWLRRNGLACTLLEDLGALRGRQRDYRHRHDCHWAGSTRSGTIAPTVWARPLEKAQGGGDRARRQWAPAAR